MIVRHFNFSQFHNKRPPAGSTFIRMLQMEKYWDELGQYKYGEDADVLIFQKVYCTSDYKFPAQYEKTTILDICDPDWLDGNAVKETADGVDAITTPTEPIAEFIRQLTDKPIKVIPDRFDLSVIPKPKKHLGKAKLAVWFGYAHNAEAIRFAIKSLQIHGIKLLVISNEDPSAWRWANDDYKKMYTYKKYKEETIYQELQKADFAILPKHIRPQDEFKSNNRTIKANLAGLPVVTDKESLELYIDGSERQKWVDEELDKIKLEYDIKNSIKDYKDLIKEL